MVGLFLPVLGDEVADKGQSFEEFDGLRVGPLYAPDELAETGLSQNVFTHPKLSDSNVTRCELSEAEEYGDCCLSCGDQAGR